MAITDWPAAERPREKLLQRGPQALSDAELLAIFLRTGTRGMSAVDLARDLLSHFRGLRELLAADKNTFCAFPGMGEAKYAQLQAAMEMATRYLQTPLRRDQPLESPAAAQDYLRSRLGAYRREVFACLFLDNRHCVLHYAELFQGTIDGAAVHPREVAREALRQNAAAVILAHNHPSGVAEPSDADRRITRRLVDALALLDVRVLDHIVVGDRESVSLAQRGWL
ncbi:MAG: DNA repair protein RadC [Pseudomonadota bacterium]